MRKRPGFVALIGLVVVLGISGCAEQFVITTDLAEPLQSPARFLVGSITDELPPTVEAKNKPSAEDMGKFRRYLTEELDKFAPTIQVAQAGNATYEITGGIMQYKKGSGFLRFMIGLGAGSAKVLTQLKVAEVATGEIIFAGNFEGAVTDWTETGDMMFRKIARNFAKELNAQHAAK